jgi:carotenoid cleavage dioxygenase
VTNINKYENRYLAGNFAPVKDENFNVPMKIEYGAIPNDLSGLFLRIGPNPIPHHIMKRYHWFDGHGMIHSGKFYK